MPDSTLPLPTEPIPPQGPHGHEYDYTAPAPVSPPPYPHQALIPVSLPAPVTVPTPGPPPPIVCRIQEIAVSPAMVYTPTAEMPLRGSHWMMTEQWQVHTKIPTWAILMCIFTICFFPFNFFFLLAKDTYYTGFALVTVSNHGRQYAARIPVSNQAQVANLQNQVNYVRSLAAL